MSPQNLNELDSLISNLHTLMRRMDIKDQESIDAVKSALASAQQISNEVKPKTELGRPKTKTEELIS
jgi:hypothetical protein